MRRPKTNQGRRSFADRRRFLRRDRSVRQPLAARRAGSDQERLCRWALGNRLHRHNGSARRQALRCPPRPAESPAPSRCAVLGLPVQKRGVRGAASIGGPRCLERNRRWSRKAICPWAGQRRPGQATAQAPRRSASGQRASPDDIRRWWFPRPARYGDRAYPRASNPARNRYGLRCQRPSVDFRLAGKRARAGNFSVASVMPTGSLAGSAILPRPSNRPRALRTAA